MKLDRRRFLRAAGVSLALPWLDALVPSGTPAAENSPPRRMVCICTPLGLHAPNLFPQRAGRDYALTPYLEVLREFRNDMTVISGLSHPEVGSSHDSIYSFLTAAQQRLTGSIRGCTNRRGDAAPQPGPFLRGLQPVLDPLRRYRAVRNFPFPSLRQVVPRGPAGGSPSSGEAAA